MGSDAPKASNGSLKVAPDDDMGPKGNCEGGEAHVEAPNSGEEEKVASKVL